MVLPVRTPQADDDHISFEKPEIAPVMDKEIIRGENRTRNVIHDTVTNEWSLEDFSDEGECKLLSNGIEHGSINKNTYKIKENDPLAARAECE